ncbi:TetR/AcrR family transcriptional regulator [Aromatoleum toluclasticum]|uniref:TetR/AcrR family transcriptional regulator n=1 Tax=Aromatoleum toluclasticum TaxID=92003 RepID=UPI00036F094F|nr:TetR/AcrR family transcriptional regulator [Aromatoleum toluclasticum]
MTTRKTPRDTALGKGRLPAPRKLPTQSRSRSLVAALIEACLQILEEEGAEALTVNRLADVSGVAVGSIYQYFPNKEAIVSLAFDHILHEEATVHVPALRERIVGLSLEGALREILANMVRQELRLHRLNREFHLKYHPDLQVGLRLGPYENTRQYVEEAWGAFVKLYVPTLDAERADMAAYMIAMAMRAAIRVALEDAPERVGRPMFLDCLLGMALGALGFTSPP